MFVVIQSQKGSMKLAMEFQCPHRPIPFWRSGDVSLVLFEPIQPSSKQKREHLMLWYTENHICFMLFGPPQNTVFSPFLTLFFPFFYETPGF